MQLELYSGHARFFFAKKSSMQMPQKLCSGSGRFYRLDIVCFKYDWNTTVAMSIISLRYLPK